MQSTKDETLAKLAQIIDEAYLHLDIVNSTHKQRLDKLKYYIKRELSTEMLECFIEESQKILKFYSKF